MSALVLREGNSVAKLAFDSGVTLSELFLGVGSPLSSSDPFVIARHFPDPLFSTFPWKEEKGGLKLSSEEPKLKEAAGQSFKLTCTPTLQKESFRVDLSIVSDFDSLIGALFPLQGALQLTGSWKSEGTTSQGKLSLPGDPLTLDQPVALHPLRSPCESSVRVKTKEAEFEIAFETACQEVAWLLCPARERNTLFLGAVTSQNPWRPNLTASAISLRIKAL